MKKQQAVLLLIFITLLVLTVVLLDRPEPMEMIGLEPKNTIHIPVEKECDVRISDCWARLGEYGLNLNIDPQVRPLETFSVQLRSEGWQPQQATVYFSMQGMEMGLNRFLLKPVDDAWQGSAMLPVCTDRRSDWVATVFVSHGGERYRAEFSFSIQ